MKLIPEKRPFILIVDGNIQNLSVLASLLGEEKYKVGLAKNGKDALLYLENNRPDLVILDIMMPEMDGFTVHEIMKKQPLFADIPVIFVSAVDNPDIMVRALENGAVDYITKPFHKREIISRINTHLKLISTRSHYSLTCRTGKIGVWEIDLNEKSIFIDPIIFTLLGYADLSLVRKSSFRYLYSLIRRDERRMILNLLKLLVNGDIREYQFEHSLKNGDGQEKQFLFVGNLIHNSAGEPLKIQGTFQDISTRVEYEKLLSETILSVETIIENLPAGMLLLDNNLKVVKINRNARTMAEEFSDELMPGVYLNNLSFMGLSPKVLENIIHRPYNKEEIIFSNTEHLWYIIQTSFHFQIKKENYIIINWINITERAEMEKKLKAAKEQAEKATKVKTMFLANMSHEIRTPLNAIIGMNDLALMTSNPEKQLEHLITVKDSSHHLLRIINDILDFSRIESDRMELQEVSFPLQEMVNNLINTLKYSALEKGLHLIYQPNMSGDTTVLGDPDRIRQILTNLISNAIKFTDRGEVTVTCTTTIPDNHKISLDETAFYFQIKDTGIGIPQEKQSEIFESFHQLASARKAGGTGLGLAISKQLVEMMNGRIYVQSMYGEGSTFSFYVVLKKTGALPEKRRAPAEMGKWKDKIFRILMAEDNLINIRLTKLVLEKTGHKVDVAENGIEAINKLKANEYDLVLMDIEMPVMDGIEATRRIRAGEAGKEKKDITIIALTAHAINEIKSQAMNTGMDGYITKPIEITRLSQTIIEIQDGKSR